MKSQDLTKLDDYKTELCQLMKTMGDIEDMKMNGKSEIEKYKILEKVEQITYSIKQKLKNTINN